MTLPTTILVPTDFGRAAEAALDHAIDLAGALRPSTGPVEIVLLHAYEMPLLGVPDGALVATTELIGRVIESAQEALDRAIFERRGRGIPMRPLLEQGDPWRVVIDTASAVGAGLIVMGTHGRHGLPRALIGSVAERVVRTASVPVLTVHEPETRSEETAA